MKAPIRNAMKALKATIATAPLDSLRPSYHFCAPGGWMGDVNAPIYHQGQYHLFYQHRPGIENIHWGHARSSNLVHWEDLPVALWPSVDAGEEHCFSGDITISPAGVPTIFYTSMPGWQQSAATGDEALVEWTKVFENPVLPDTVHIDQVQIGFWRDPFVFGDGGHTYIIVGGWEGATRGVGSSRGIVSLYRALNEKLTRWEYLGPLFYHPVSQDNACPNFFRIGAKWILLMSRHNPHVCDYFVGTWDPETHEFHPEYADALGYTESVYGSQGLFDHQGRLIVWNTLHNYRSTGMLEDWSGCLTLPRVVSLQPDSNALNFDPVPELEALRGRHHKMTDVRLSRSPRFIEEIQGDALEISADFDPGNARAFGLRVRCSRDGTRGLEICYDGSLKVEGTCGVFAEDDTTRRPFKLLPNESMLSLRVFVDNAIVEVFANRRCCFETLIHSNDRISAPLDMPRAEDQNVVFFAKGGSAVLCNLDIWELRSIR